MKTKHKIVTQFCKIICCNINNDHNVQSSDSIISSGLISIKKHLFYGAAENPKLNIDARGKIFLNYGLCFIK